MRLMIDPGNAALSAAERDRVERRLAFALGRFGDRIGRVGVCLSAVDRRDGALSVWCKIEVEVAGCGTVVVEDTDTAGDSTSVIDRAADRIGRAVGRRLVWTILFPEVAGGKLNGRRG